MTLPRRISTPDGSCRPPCGLKLEVHRVYGRTKTEVNAEQFEVIEKVVRRALQEERESHSGVGVI